MRIVFTTKEDTKSTKFKNINYRTLRGLRELRGKKRGSVYGLYRGITIRKFAQAAQTFNYWTRALALPRVRNLRRASTADQAGAGSGCIVIGLLSVDKKPTQPDQTHPEK